MRLNTAIFASLALLAGANFSRAYDIYSNTNAAGDQNFNFSAGGLMIGDEIVPAGSGYLNHIDFQYYLTNSSGNEAVRLVLFQNDGAALSLVNRTAYEPNTVLFDSGFFNIGGMGDTARSTLNYDAGVGPGFDFAPNSIFISGSVNLTLAIEFSGITGIEDAGVTLYDFPTVGSGFNSYWEYNGSTWTLSTNATPNGYVDFGMRIDAVPEPTAFSVLVIGGLTLLGVRRFSLRK